LRLHNLLSARKCNHNIDRGDFIGGYEIIA